MDTFSTTSIFVIIILAVLGLLSEFIYVTFIEKEKKFSLIRAIIIAVVSASLGFCAEKILEIDHKVNENAELLGKYVTIHNSSIEYLTALENLSKLEKQSPFRFVLQEELQFINVKLRQIQRYELILKREEVIPKWESLIENSNNEILATNIVSLDEWKEFSMDEGKESHEKALKKGVTIKRIFIYNGSNDKNYNKLVEKAKAQIKWGVKVRLLDGGWIKKTSYLSDLLRDVGTLDIVIYDNECALLTNVGSGDNIVNSTLTNDEYKLKKSQEFYTKLWGNSKGIPK